MRGFFWLPRQNRGNPCITCQRELEQQRVQQLERRQAQRLRQQLERRQVQLQERHQRGLQQVLAQQQVQGLLEQQLLLFYRKRPRQLQQ